MHWRPNSPAAPRFRQRSGNARSSLVDEDGSEIVDIGARRAGDDQIAQSFEKAIGVVVRKKGRCIEAPILGARDRVGRNQRAGIVLRSVYAVGVAGDGRDVRSPIERDGERQSEFGIAPAASLALERYRRLAA